PPASARPYRPTEEWTCLLLERGFSLHEAAAIRGLEPSAILRHVALAARQGRKVPLDALLAPDLLARWDAWHREHGEAPPPPEPGIAPELWPLYLACRTPDG
ncbi:MAG: helix-turn-helix domain-containing protein, partial [Isosphaeraceae bacterium]|nr:helix-turn-helix domain-containing protein [Isosphaeraceae bacterium]